MSLVFTMPGCIGDALLQWPVAYHYCKQQDARCTLWLDEKKLKPLVPLFEAQPCVEKVELKPGIERYNMGGQPYDFGLTTKDYVDHEIYHLGFRSFPSRQITLETLNTVPFKLDPREVAQEPSLTVGELHATPEMVMENVVLHGKFASHHTGVPSFWKVLAQVKDDLPGLKIFVGTAPERKRAREIYPAWEDYDDGGDFLSLAHLLLGTRLVLACGSSVAALASVLKVPCVRVHDPIGEAPKVIWSGLGENQWNETELDLRRLWPEIRDKVMGGVVA